MTEITQLSMKGGNSIVVFAPHVHVSFYALALSSQGAISNKTGEFWTDIQLVF